MLINLVAEAIDRVASTHRKATDVLILPAIKILAERRAALISKFGRLMEESLTALRACHKMWLRPQWIFTNQQIRKGYYQAEVYMKGYTLRGVSDVW